jgi:DDE_Tnp_1-associated
MVAVVAVLTGARSLATIGEWAADAPGQVLPRSVCRDLLTRAFRPPGEAAVRRVLARIDAEALDRTIGAWLASQQPPPPSHHHRRRPAHGGRGRGRRRRGRSGCSATTTSTHRGSLPPAMTPNWRTG